MGTLLISQADTLWPEGLPDDVQLYLELTKNRKFYQYIMDLCGISENERDRFKKTVFGSIFYCKNWTAEQKENKAGQVFINNFPNVYEAIKKLKGKDRSLLPIALMSEESNIIIQQVCSKIANLNDNTFFIATIHDCILTTEDKSLTVKELIAEVFKNKFGQIPTIKEEKIN